MDWLLWSIFMARRSRDRPTRPDFLPKCRPNVELRSRCGYRRDHLMNVPSSVSQHSTEQRLENSIFLRGEEKENQNFPSHSS